MPPDNTRLYNSPEGYRKMMAAYDAALTLEPDYALAHRDIGILYDLYLQQPAQALTHYKRYLELAGDDPPIDPDPGPRAAGAVGTGSGGPVHRATALFCVRVQRLPAAQGP